MSDKSVMDTEIKMMKHIFFMILVIVVLVLDIAGCSRKSKNAEQQEAVNESVAETPNPEAVIAETPSPEAANAETPNPEELNVLNEPAAKTRMDPMAKVDAINKMMAEAWTEEEARARELEAKKSAEESSAKKSAVPDWKSDDEILASKELSDYAKYAFALDRAVFGCTLEDIKRLEDDDYDKMKPYILWTIFEEQDRDFNCSECAWLRPNCKGSKDDALVKKLIENKADINAYNDKGVTLLFETLSYGGNCFSGGHGNTLLFDKLLELGADITKPNADGTTILMRTESPKTAKKYIKSGGDVNAKNKNGKTALEYQEELLRKMNVFCERNEDDPDYDVNCDEYFYQEALMGVEEDGKTCADHARDDIKGIISLIKKTQKKQDKKTDKAK